MPTTKHRLAVNLDNSDFDELAAMSEKYQVSLAWLGRQAILEFIARYRTEQLQLPFRQRDRDARTQTDGHAA